MGLFERVTSDVCIITAANAATNAARGSARARDADAGGDVRRDLHEGVDGGGTAARRREGLHHGDGTFRV